MTDVIRAREHFAKGQSLLSMSRVDSACEELEAATRAWPGNIEYRLAAANAFGRLDNSSRALQFISEAVRVTRPSEAGWLRYLLAESLLAAARPVEAIQTSQETIAGGIDFSELHQVMAEGHLSLGRLDIYLLEMGKAANLKPPLAKSWVEYNTAKTLLSLGMFSDALSKIDNAIQVQASPHFIRLRNAIKAVTPSPVLATSWREPPPESQTRALVTVSFKEELPLLRLQARSIAKFVNSADNLSIIVIVNDPDFAGFLELFDRLVRPEYGLHEERLVVLDRQQVMEHKYDSGGWRSQQALKLLAARHTNADQLIILDSKNHLIRNLEISCTLAEDGASISWLTDRTKDFFNDFVATYKYFDLEPHDFLEHCLPTITPFAVSRRLVLEAMDFVEKKEAKPFGSFLLGEGWFLTEFLLVSAWCQRRYGSLSPAFRFGPERVVGIWEATLKTPNGVYENIAGLSKRQIYMFSVHRKASACLQDAQLDLIAAMWRRRGLLGPSEDAKEFLPASSVGHLTALSDEQKKRVLASFNHHVRQALLMSLTRERYGEVQFLQIGGNDGALADPLLSWHRQFPWTGTIVEPIPHYFQRLLLLHENNPRITPIKYAVSDTAGTLDIHYVRPDAELKYEPWVAGLASIDRLHLIRQGVDANDCTIETVDCIEPKALLALVSIKLLDLLCIDVEGHEYAILTSFPYHATQVKLTMFEIWHMPMAQRENLRSWCHAQGMDVFFFWEDGYIVNNNDLVRVSMLRELESFARAL